MEPSVAVEKFFQDMLMPRNHGLISIVKLREMGGYNGRYRDREDADGFLVSLGSDPFLELNLEDGSITLMVTYPESIAIWDTHKEDWRAGHSDFKPLSKNPKIRAKQLHSLAVNRLRKFKQIKFDLFEPDSLARAEFYTQTIISKIKYMVGKVGFNSRKIKDGVELIDLIDNATLEYNKKVVAPTRKKYAEA